MTTLHWSAWCHACTETPPPGADADRWADRHTRDTGHPTGSAGLPANQGEHVNRPEPPSAASPDPELLEQEIAEAAARVLYAADAEMPNTWGESIAAEVMAVLRMRGMVK